MHFFFFVLRFKLYTNTSKMVILKNFEYIFYKYLFDQIVRRHIYNHVTEFWVIGNLKKAPNR